MTVKAIPDGFNTVTPFLNIKNAASAIDAYKNALGAEELMRMHTPTGAVAMCVLKLGNSRLRIADAIQDPPTQSSLACYFEDANAVWERAVAAGFEIVVPIQDMFFGDRFGILKDAFGNRWSIAQHIEDVPPDEIKRRAVEGMKAFERK